MPRLIPRPPDPLPPAPPDFAPVIERIDRLEAAVPKLLPPPVIREPVTPVDLTPVLERLDVLAAQRPASSQDGQLIALVEQRLGAGINAMIARSESATASSQASADALVEQGKAVTELSTALRGLRTVVDRLEQAGPAASARVEASISRVARATDEVPTKVDASIGRIAGMAADLRGELQSLIESVAKATADSIDALKTDIAAVKARVDMPPPPPSAPAPKDDGESAARVVEAVRREAELLTQRVAALAVGVEATRALLDQHVDDTAESLGRKASDFGRRLAADFGIKGRKGSRSNDRRELGPGSS